MVIFGEPDMNEVVKNISNRLVRNTKFWIGTGMGAEAAFEKVVKDSYAGPIPIKMAREALGLPV